ncbi:tRNA lysidine(34) synthetase TilS [Thiocapsa imhoffii]|uniref:tRNA(Ile)-lysidine synthase n=1 Tax=Thiocapsa imhoffii TaxID=382777 RepID=A0A9X0WFI2_9GAMM|nr:tRNA lysidine(34) synthetase TilS [Thiocapsa imhoffii]MBK1643601.1 tRNA lysidine(34) synthetase TilS [Thiocapsa imhoffii]
MTGFVPGRLVADLDRLAPVAECWLAFSGGLDSTVLLHALHAVRADLPGRLRVIHLDHGLHPDSARWAAHCRAVCENHDLPFEVQRLNLQPVAGMSVEALARTARYRACAARLQPGDLLLTAHTQDDQAETLLLALIRGSGVQGLAAMPSVTALGLGRLARPLLGVSRAALAAYAKAQGLRWIDDPSNDALWLDRNLLRHRVMPLLRRRWPAVSETLARSANHCAEVALWVDALASSQLAETRGTRPGTLDCRILASLARPEQKAVLRLWIRQRGFALPSTRVLERVLEEILPAGPDADPLVAWSGCEIRRYRHDLFAIPPLPLPPSGALDWSPDQQRAGLRLPPPLGQLRWIHAPFERMESSARFGEGDAMTVRFGVRGALCRVRTGGPRRALKKVFQDAAIPRWVRPFVPLVFLGESLIAIAGVRGCVADCPGPTAIPALEWIEHPWSDLELFRHDETSLTGVAAS